MSIAIKDAVTGSITGGSGVQDPTNPDAQESGNPLRPPTVDQDPHDPTHQDPALDQGVLSSAQVPGSPNYDSTFASVIPAWVQLTDTVYWASKPKAVQDLQKLAGLPSAVPVPAGQNPAYFTPRYLAAKALLAQGYQIDAFIDAFGYDPVVAMLLRSAGVPSSLLDPANYPPFYPPAPVVVPTTKIVGPYQGFVPYLGGKYYSAGPDAIHAASAGVIMDGGFYSQDGVSYKVHITMGLMGETIWFTL